MNKRFSPKDCIWVYAAQIYQMIQLFQCKDEIQTLQCFDLVL